MSDNEIAPVSANVATTYSAGNPDAARPEAPAAAPAAPAAAPVTDVNPQAAAAHRAMTARPATGAAPSRPAQVRPRLAGLDTTDPFRAMDAGNPFRAVDLFEARLNARLGDREQRLRDQQGLALARYRSLDWAGAARDFEQLLSAQPDHEFAPAWDRYMQHARNAQATGEGEFQPNPLNMTFESDVESPEMEVAPTFYYPEGNAFARRANDALGWAFQIADNNVERLLDGMDRLYGEEAWYKEWKRRGQFDDVPEQAFENASIGREMLLRLVEQDIYAVRVLANQRDALIATRVVPDDAVPAPITDPTASQGGMSYDGRQIDPNYANSGGVGEAIPVHGTGGVDDIDPALAHLLPSPAVIAEAFLYRPVDENGQDIVTLAPHLNVLVADHLFELPHDVKQTLFADGLVQATPVRPGSFEESLGLANDWVPTNEVNEAGGHLSASTGAWDGDQWYGRNEAEVIHRRTDPNTGELMPNGQIYLDEGRWIPEIIVNGRPVLDLPVGQNRTLGSIAVATMYMREHNRRAEMLSEVEPHLSDNQVYWLVRRSIVASYAKGHTASWTPVTFGDEAIVTGLHTNSHGFLEAGRPMHEMQLWDPSQGEDLIMGGMMANREVSNQYDVLDWKGEDFSPAYTAPGHTMQPAGYDPALFGFGETASAEDEEFIPIERTIGVAGNRILRERGLGAVLRAAMHTPIGLPTLNNHPNFMRGMPTAGGMTSLAEMDILRTRERGNGNYALAFARMNLPVPTSYADIFADEEVIARLEELYGPYNEAVREATGNPDFIYIDNVVGQLGDYNRPTDTVVPNLTFQTFGGEASARLMLNDALSLGTHPEHLGMPLLNSVQEDWPIDLVYRHGGDDNPELRDELRNRPHPSLFSNQARPDLAHPIEEFFDMRTGENMYGDGSGLPREPKHDTGEGLENNEVFVVTYEGRGYLVDVTDSRIWVDHDGDRNIVQRDGVFSPLEGPSRDQLLDAARNGAVDRRLELEEVRRLIQRDYDENNVGVQLSGHYPRPSRAR